MMCARARVKFVKSLKKRTSNRRWYSLNVRSVKYYYCSVNGVSCSKVNNIITMRLKTVHFFFQNIAFSAIKVNIQEKKNRRIRRRTAITNSVTLVGPTTIRACNDIVIRPRACTRQCHWRRYVYKIRLAGGKTTKKSKQMSAIRKKRKINKTSSSVDITYYINNIYIRIK